MEEHKEIAGGADNYAERMKQSQEELTQLRQELRNLMVKFGLRVLKLYQTGTPVPLKSTEISYLVKYELDNAIHDLAEEKSIEAIIKQTKAEWEKQQQK